LWNINKIRHFNTFYQKGTNHSGCEGVEGEGEGVSSSLVDILTDQTPDKQPNF